MGNTLGCSASGERLISAARDGDAVEAKMLLQLSPALARYSTFGGLNSPLHFAAAKGHNDIVNLLLENGADVNLRNYCGQTALMQACRHGHWEVVQTMLLFRCNVTKADYLSGRTALHFAAIEGHAHCLRLLVADYIPSAPYGSSEVEGEGQGQGSSSPDNPPCQKSEQLALSRFVNKAADGGLTALHMAALNAHHECVQLLLDLHANVSAVTFQYGASINLIGAGSTPLHYGASGGSLKCCQMLLSRGASRWTLNCNGWLPVDVARMWGRHWLEPLLAPNSEVQVPRFPLSSYLALPLLSILSIAREYGLQSSSSYCDDNGLCPVCLERICTVAAEGCGHEFCVKCSLCFCSTSRAPTESTDPPGSIPCPLCRSGIVCFVKLPKTSGRELKSSPSLSLCTSCMLQPQALDSDEVDYAPEFRRNCPRTHSSELICPVTCSPFPSIALPSCRWDEEAAPAEPQGETPDQSPRQSQSTANQDKLDEHRVERTTCTNIFWSRRSCSREHQCNEEINA